MLHAGRLAAARRCCWLPSCWAPSCCSPVLLLVGACCMLTLLPCPTVFTNNQKLHFIAQLFNSSSIQFNCPQPYKSITHVTVEVHHSNCHDLFNKPMAIWSRKPFMYADSSFCRRLTSTWLRGRCLRWNIVLITITTIKGPIHYSTRSNEVIECHACNDNLALLMRYITWHMQQNPQLHLQNSKRPLDGISKR